MEAYYHIELWPYWLGKQYENLISFCLYFNV